MLAAQRGGEPGAGPGLQRPSPAPRPTHNPPQLHQPGTGRGMQPLPAYAPSLRAAAQYPHGTLWTRVCSNLPMPCSGTQAKERGAGWCRRALCACSCWAQHCALTRDANGRSCRPLWRRGHGGQAERGAELCLAACRRRAASLQAPGSHGTTSAPGKASCSLCSFLGSSSRGRTET